MAMCNVDFNGGRGTFEIVRENTNTVWVRIGETTRTVMRRVKQNASSVFPEEYSSVFSHMPMEPLIGVPTPVEIDGREIIKRHKVKHNFERV